MSETRLVKRPLFWAILGGAAFTLGYLTRRVAMNIFTDRREFIDRLWVALDQAAMALNRPEIGAMQKTILIAQAIHESGWGAANTSKKAFNYWNLTAGPHWTGPTLEAPDTEFSAIHPEEPAKKITSQFRLYRSDLEAAADMLKFIGPGTRYSGAYDVLRRGDVMAYIAALREKGFFTQPLDKYQSGVREAIKTVVQYKG